MPSYSQEPEDQSRSAKSRGSHLRVHFKHCREVCHTIKGLPVGKAKKFLEAVLEKKAAVPFTKFTGGVGRHAQGKTLNAPGDKCRWPQKATKIILDLVKNAEANAELKGLDTDKLYIAHTQANAAIKQRRRTYRAHGRIGPYMSNPAHIELILTEKKENVAKAEDAAPAKISRKRNAQLRLKSGGGVAN
ncbi:50S ribosomal protein L22 [Saprolegnia diclina VS20]|uniref:50S ribosomal protein L22 n=2 Tax=Saprolegnia TaxID=4769 RepID=A0A067CFI1_SAPPC|nr:50S ribosomal protein L22 [Saprolegnia diclina VS20]XP_012200075.1 50S ribosomal protein L22 [Saprolegnia parasitica CBS 223.65]EQC33641.1 50S ribosomal protein L22 [Saprolegnia diclina VS20]KDO29228.1 50S ribosomal protein L22 [Saprolegnia parasitica CBS 223.65]|eukprot:XP_008612864.1 50S ribosomal protein L22 [Saprolegnia diclina VS20]